MVGHEGFPGDARQRLAHHYETAVRSLAMLRGFSTLGDSQIGRIVDDAVAGASLEERRNPDHPPTSSFSRLEGLLRDAVEADRPRNIHSAEAARLAQLGAHGAAALLGHKGYADLQRSRLEGREGRDGGERGGSSGSGRSGDRYGELPVAGDRVSSAVMGAYVQSYAGTGLARGTVQNFAEIGLQRGVYDAYRKEGFSREDIGDAAKTAKVLEYKNDRQAFDDVQRSSKPQRAAIVEIHREKDPAKRDALIERKGKELDIEHKPQTEQERWGRLTDRERQRGLKISQEQGRDAAGNQSDGTVNEERAREHGKPAAAKVRVAKLEASEAKGGKASAKAMDDDFGKTVTPPTKLAEIKPNSLSPKA